MARVQAGELATPITDVLTSASTGKGTDRGFLTAYQILRRLPGSLQARLASEYGDSGKEAGQPFGPASRVAQVAAGLAGVEKRYLDTGDLQFDVGQTQDVEAGYNLCAIFRLP
jgi:hypothetical protein